MGKHTVEPLPEDGHQMRRRLRHLELSVRKYPFPVVSTEAKPKLDPLVMASPCMGDSLAQIEPDIRY